MKLVNQTYTTSTQIFFLMIAIVRNSLLVASTFQTVDNTGRQNYDTVYEILFQNLLQKKQCKLKVSYKT